mgnify:CR=1 FL=1
MATLCPLHQTVDNREIRRGRQFRKLSETLFLRDIGRDLPTVLDVRARVLADLGQRASAPAPAFIQQAPLGQGEAFELASSAVIPRRRDTWSVRDVAAAPACASALGWLQRSRS